MEPPPPPPPLEAHAPFAHVPFAVTWMVETDENAWGQIQWVEFPWETEKRLEDMYWESDKGLDEYVP